MGLMTMYPSSGVSFSYNGKVWLGKWESGAKPVFDPYAQVAA